MATPSHVAFCFAVAIAALAAAYDIRFGTIPNWVSIPPIFIAPLVYAALLGVGFGIQSSSAALLSGAGPYILFRMHGMGGGDVKLFATLGAVTGFDPLAGLRIQLAAFAVALVIALAGQALRGRLSSTLSALVATARNRVLPTVRRRSSEEVAGTPVRMGAAIFVGTVLALLPQLELALPRGE